MTKALIMPVFLNKTYLLGKKNNKSIFYVCLDILLTPSQEGAYEIVIFMLILLKTTTMLIKFNGIVKKRVQDLIKIKVYICPSSPPTPFHTKTTFFLTLNLFKYKNLKT